MALAGQVQPVRAPRPRVAQRPHRPQVDQVAAAGVGDSPQVHVVGGDPAAQQPDDREHARVEAGEDEHPAADGLQPATAGSNCAASLSTSDPRRMSLPPAATLTRSGAMLDGARHLLGHDLGQQLAADGQVGVPEPGRLFGQCRGHPVGPADESAVRERVIEALGEAVAEGHEGADRGPGSGSRIGAHDAIPHREQPPARAGRGGGGEPRTVRHKKGEASGVRRGAAGGGTGHGRLGLVSYVESPVPAFLFDLDGTLDRQRVPARHRLAGGAVGHRHRPVGVADPPADRDERRAVRVRAAARDRAVAVGRGDRASCSWRTRRSTGRSWTR